LKLKHFTSARQRIAEMREVSIGRTLFMAVVKRSTCRAIPAWGWASWVLALGLAEVAARAEAGVSYLSNKVIKIGVDFDKGGSITYLAQLGKSKNAGYYNVVNSHDLGRQIQQSYYSGPSPFDPRHNQARQWYPWPWNPIQTGDCYGHRAKVLDNRNDGRQIYVKTRPMQWALNNVPGEATFETWIHLEGNAAWVRCRLTNRRTDTKQQFVGYYHECPAVLTVGTLPRLFTYQGLAPFTGDKISELPRVPPPWQYWCATENWAAHVDKSGWGVGIYHPGAVLFSGGFYGTPGRGGPYDNTTGYMAPIRGEVLDYNIVYEYQYALILGTLDEIRQFVYAHQPDLRPDYRFLSDRQHWFCLGGDAGFPINGYLRMNLAGSDPAMLGPPCAWQAEDVPTIYITAAYHVSDPKPDTAVGRLYWKLNNESQPWVTDVRESQSVAFDVIVDGQFHTYTLDLASCPTYQGTITQLRLDPVVRGSSGDTVDVRYITYRSDLLPPEPTTTPEFRGSDAWARGGQESGTFDRPAAANGARGSVLGDGPPQDSPPRMNGVPIHSSEDPSMSEPPISGNPGMPISPRSPADAGPTGENPPDVGDPFPRPHLHQPPRK
jgi:hypothetical protein